MDKPPDKPAGAATRARVDCQSPIPWDRRDRLLLIVLTVVACPAILPNLADRCLWADEAEAGLLARAILRTGLPRTWDGRLFTTTFYGHESTDSMLWQWHPWGSFYLAAVGLALAGDSPLGARLPMALLGCASIGLTYVVARRLVQDRWAACLAAVLLLTTVQYLLMMRQCRYYAMLPVGALIAVWGYAELSRRRGLIALAAAMIGLFHSNYVTFFCVGAGLGLHALMRRRDRATWIRLGLAAAVALVPTAPWFFAVGLHRSAGTLNALGYHRDPIATSLIKQFFVVNQFVCPWLVTAVLIVWALRRKLQVGGAYGLVLCLTVPVMTVVPVLLWAGPRYLIHLIPFGAIVVAAGLRELYLRNDLAGNIGAIVAGVTNLLPSILCGVLPSSVGTTWLDGDFATGPGAVHQAMLKSEWAGYVEELRTPFVGHNEAIARFLLKNSHPDDRVYVPYEGLSLMFATGRRCAGLLKEDARRRPGWERLPDYLFDPDAADWLVIRPAWKPLEGYDAIVHRWEERAKRVGGRLEFHYLQVPDIGWGNRPELRYHYFTSPMPDRSRQVVIVELRRPDRDSRSPGEAEPRTSGSSGVGRP